jgi:hypothetical protein
VNVSEPLAGKTACSLIEAAFWCAMRVLVIAIIAILAGMGKLFGDVPTAGAILDRFMHPCTTPKPLPSGRSYRLKDHATAAGKEDKTRRPNPSPTNFDCRSGELNGSLSGSARSTLLQTDYGSA